MHADRGWLEGGITLAPFISGTSAVAKSCAGAGENPFAKMRDSTTDTVNRLQTKAQSEASQTHQCIKETVPRSSRSRVLRFSTRQRESVPGGDAMWHSICSATSCRSVAPFSTWLHGSDARNEQDLGTNRWQEDKVHRTVRPNETERPERKGGWNNRSEATGAAHHPMRARAATTLPDFTFSYFLQFFFLKLFLNFFFVVAISRLR